MINYFSQQGKLTTNDKQDICVAYKHLCNNKTHIFRFETHQQHFASNNPKGCR